MLAKKKSKKSCWSGLTVLFVLMLLVLAGCTPAGPRALLKGKRYIERGDYPDAVAQLKLATTLLATNAGAWNYYGVALQHSGQADDAANAYKRALELDRDLVEAHYNLGSLWLEQNKPDLARTEFTAYTLRRNNDADGWLKLGIAQLRSGEIDPAERSFSAVRSLKPNDPEVYNWLGLARIQANAPRDAAKFFAYAIQLQPNYASAILNLATVDQQYLRDNRAALDNYHNYLALSPRPANWDDVNALAASLEQSEVRNTAEAPLAHTNPPLAESRPAARPTPSPYESTPEYYPDTQDQTPRYTTHYQSPTRSDEADNNYSPPPSIPVQSVQVTPEQPIVTTPKTNPPATVTTTPAAPSPSPGPLVETTAPPPYKKSGFWHHIFGGSSSKPSPAESKYLGGGLTPLPPVGDPTFQPTKASDLPPARPVQPAPVFARYNYYSPRRPAKGDHSVGSPAGGAFTKARLAEDQGNLTDALEWYQQAATLDPSWFEAQYNTGVVAHRLHNYVLALPSYELALSIEPDSVDARYNFALALKSGGYPLDAANELKKILADHPDEVRAHLALANICAQSLRDTEQARAHYQKVLELDPKNTEASDIRFWLSANKK